MNDQVVFIPVKNVMIQHIDSNNQITRCGDQIFIAHALQKYQMPVFGAPWNNDISECKFIHQPSAIATMARQLLAIFGLFDGFTSALAQWATDVQFRVYPLFGAERCIVVVVVVVVKTTMAMSSMKCTRTVAVRTRLQMLRFCTTTLADWTHFGAYPIRRFCIAIVDIG
jgi:hypothetical protein